MKIINYGKDNPLITSKFPTKPIEKNKQIQQYTDEKKFNGIPFNLAKIHNSSDLITSDVINRPNTPQNRLNHHERVALVLKWANMSPDEHNIYDGPGGVQKFFADNNANYSQFKDLCRMDGKLSARGLGCLRKVAGISGPKITASHVIEWQNMSPKNRTKIGGLNVYAAKYMLPSTQLYKFISSAGEIKPAGLQFLSKEVLREQYLFTPESSRFIHTTPARPSAALYQTFWAAWENDTAQKPTELRRDAVNIMRHCLEKHSFILNLSNLNLTSLPDIIPGHILELNVISNDLSLLPDSLPRHLQRLLATDNALTALPQVLPEHLSELCLRNNALPKFPEHLPKTMSHLNISFNKMEGIICHLTDSLISLDLSNNKLNTMPDTLPNHLTWIDLCNNDIQTVPACVMHISQKTEIDLKGNPLTEQTIAELYNARYPDNTNEPKNIYF